MLNSLRCCISSAIVDCAVDDLIQLNIITISITRIRTEIDIIVEIERCKGSVAVFKHDHESSHLHCMRQWPVLMFDLTQSWLSIYSNIVDSLSANIVVDS